MGYDLYGLEDEERYERFNIFSWGKVLRLAEHFNWIPEGTTYDELEDGETWDGTYFTNDGQIVSKEDAKNLAEALERAIPALEADTSIIGVFIGDGDMEYWTKRLQEFADFCKQGAFRIY